MLIECIAKVNGTVETAISNDVYIFRPDEHGRLVCDVDREEHQRAFLSVEGVYRAAEAVGAPAPEATAVAPEAPTVAEEPSTPDEAPTDTLAGKTWDELAVLYEAKFDRKPHSKTSLATLIERLT